MFTAVFVVLEFINLAYILDDSRKVHKLFEKTRQSRHRWGIGLGMFGLDSRN